MKKPDRNALVALPVVLVIAALVALAGSQGGSTVGGFPVFALCVIVAFVIQWVAFVPAYLLQSERVLRPHRRPDVHHRRGRRGGVLRRARRPLVPAARDGRLWAVRLASYLFLRIRKAGADTRFDVIKPSFPRFLNTWTLQGLWVTLTLAAALAAITTTERVGIGTVSAIGLLVWVAGIGLEVVADAQKSRFRADPANKGRFIHTGSGRGPATPTTSARSCCGSVWRSSRFRCSAAGSGLRSSRRSSSPCCCCA